MSLRRYPRIDWHRWIWLCLRHHERAFLYYARAGKFGLAEICAASVDIYRKQLGITEP